MSPLIAAALGALWRWNDGRGYGPGWVRLIASVGLSCAILGWAWAVPLAGLWGAMWTPRQKNREEWDDMVLRWTAPMAWLGILLAIVTASLWPVAIMGGAGLIVATLVWAGVHWRYAAPHPWLDSSAVTEALSGAVAFGALGVSCA
jgi:hypothetical protein